MKSVRKISKVWKSKPTIGGAGVHRNDQKGPAAYMLPNAFSE